MAAKDADIGTDYARRDLFLSDRATADLEVEFVPNLVEETALQELFLVDPGPLGGGAFLPIGVQMSKTQYISGEPLRLTFPPFIDGTTGDRITAGDTVTLVIKRPDNTLLPVPPTPSRDGDTHFWIAEVDILEFQEGEWLIKATSDNVNALDQYQSLTWGDYVDDIPETRQAALGRWKITGTQLVLYEEDGTTPFQTFDLKDADGAPSASQIFERDPV